MRTEGRIVEVDCARRDRLRRRRSSWQDGRASTGDLFIDCSGFRGLLIEQALDDRLRGLDALAALRPRGRRALRERGPLTPYTRSTAREAGWQWRIPLQHRIGNGYVYCSRTSSATTRPAATLLANLDGKALADPRPLRFMTGDARQAWNNNVVAIGLSSGFLEPLESTSIHLIQSGISAAAGPVPDRDFEPARARRVQPADAVRVRAHPRLHDPALPRPSATTRRSGATARHGVPESLARKIDAIQGERPDFRDGKELFGAASWVQVMFGQGIVPGGYHGLVDVIAPEDISEFIEGIRRAVKNCLDFMPTHEEFIAKNCKATAPAS